MKYIWIGYLLISIAASIHAFINVGWMLGGGIFLASTLGWWAGSGLKGSILVGDKSQKIGGLITATVFLVMAHFIARYTAFSVGIGSIEIGGGIWYITGFIIGFFATTKKDAVGNDMASNY